MGERLDDRKLTELFHAPESEQFVERKASASDRDKICQAICAFSNDLADTGEPGVVFVGQNDDRSCANFPITDKLLAMIGGWRGDGKFEPFPILSVERRDIAGCVVAVVTVFPSPNTPVRYEGRVWIRVGPRRAIASAAEERRLTEKRRARDLPFDAQPIRGAAIDDLDLARFELEYLPSAVPSDVLEQNERSISDRLRALRLADSHATPTATGLLTLGKSPQSFLPGAYIEARKIDGVELASDPIVDSHEITGTIVDQARRIDELMRLWNSTRLVVGGERRVETPDYPLPALRQLARNALMHRNYEGTNAPTRCIWYADRVEFSNPGGPYGEVTIENFGRPGVTDYRNPTLAGAMKSVGLVERFGMGLEIVRSELKRNGNPPAEFQPNANFVHVTVKRR